MLLVIVLTPSGSIFATSVEHDRRAVPIRNDYFSVILAADKLIVGIDLVILAWPIEISPWRCSPSPG